MCVSFINAVQYSCERPYQKQKMHTKNCNWQAVNLYSIDIINKKSYDTFKLATQSGDSDIQHME
jgi:hypothetical protein